MVRLLSLACLAVIATSGETLFDLAPADALQDMAPERLCCARRCQGINNLADIWETSNGECVVMMQSELEKMFEKVGFRPHNASPYL